MFNWLSFYIKPKTRKASQPLRRHQMMSRVAIDHVIYARKEKKELAFNVHILFMCQSLEPLNLSAFALDIPEFPLMTRKQNTCQIG